MLFEQTAAGTYRRRQPYMLSRWVACTLLAIVSTLFPLSAVRAQEHYPDRPIHMVVPFSTGGTIDWIARSVAAQLGQRLGQPVLVENKPGANGIVGTQFVAHSDADGYTLLLVTGSFAANPSIYHHLTYDARRDFVPVTAFAKGTGMLVLVNATVPVHSVQELVSWSKRKDVHLNYGSPGVGNTIQLATELFKMGTGARITDIPYKGSAPALNALLGNQVQVMLLPPPLAMQFVHNGRLRAIGFTGTSRLPELPDVPTLRELGISMKGFEQTWVGLFAPAATPKAITAKLYTELHQILSAPDAREAFDKNAPGYLPDGRSPTEFAAEVRSDMEVYAHIIKIAGITVAH